MPEPTLSLSFALHYAPQPAFLRAVGAFERSLKGSLTRRETLSETPVVLADAKGEHVVTIGPQSFQLTVSPLTRIDRFGPSATSLASQFIGESSALAPREVELRAELVIPVPDATRSVGGYSIATFSWPRKLELRPEALGKDHYIPTETGIIHLRLSSHVASSQHKLRLNIGNRHDRVNREGGVLEQAYSLCMRGMLNVINGLSTPAYKRALIPMIAPIGVAPTAKHAPPGPKAT